MGGVSASDFDPTTGEGWANIMTGGTYSMSGADGGKSGGGKGAQAPEAPDFVGAVDRQAEAARDLTREQTAANRPDQNTPFGSSTWTQDPRTGQWTQNVGFSPGLETARQGFENQLAGFAGEALPSGDAARQQAIESAYGQAASRLDPQWATRGQALESQLANQGLTVGSEAYGNAQRDFNLGRNDAYTSAMANAIGQGTQAGESIFRQGLLERQLPGQQLGMLQGLGGAPGFATAGSSQAPNYLGALGQQYQGALNQYGIDQAGKNSTLGGLTGLGGAAILASDERLKINVVRSMIEVIPGVPLASWDWKAGGKGRGVIAQDLEKVRPDLVIRDADGMRFVNYGGLMEAAHG